MATFSKQFLSSSMDGGFFGLAVEVKTSSSYPNASLFGTGIHTPPEGSTELDEVWLYATNVGTAAKTLVIQFGNTGSAYEIVQELPSRSGLVLMVPGLVIGKTGSFSDFAWPQSGSQIAAYAGGTADSTTSDILITGYVNRISGST